MADRRAQAVDAPGGYGAFERKMAKLLADFPRLKIWMRHVYTRVVYQLSGGHEALLVARARVVPVGPANAETFFGYYDKSPVSSAGRLLCHVSHHSSTRSPHPDRRLTVQVLDLDAQGATRRALSFETRSYNWQQGARAHWLDDEHFIFNDFDPEARRYISRVHSASDGAEAHRYEHPVQDSHGRAYFLSINYRRLQALRPEYGYCNLPPLNRREITRLEDDGIWHVNQGTGQSRLLYSLLEVCRTDPEADFMRARHKLNHVMIAPDGRRFIFLHRYFINGRKRDRLLLGTPDGAPLRVLSAHGMVSHCFWINDASLLCYLRGPEKRDGYYTIDVATGETTSLFRGVLDSLGDGHPHVRGDWLVTDTYPDRRRMQRLMRANLRTGEIAELGRFHQGFRYDGATRCDLHPRISPDGRRVFFDSVCSGRRRLYFLDLDPDEEL